MEAEERATGQADAKAAVTILHISDLHFGRAFSRDLWKGLCDIAADEIQPDLVIATGDFVNSPWRWRLKETRRELHALKQRLGTTRPCELIAVLGNHDTRFSGLVPVRWVLFAVFATLLLGATILGWWLGSVTSFLWITLTLTVILWVVADICFGDVNDFLNEFLCRDPLVYPEWGVAIFPFDSASAGVRTACGTVPRQQFGDAKVKATTIRKTEIQEKKKLYRIAILHHHPLPIPYDSDLEDMLILQNAGAFLQEMSELQIRLILHGHKHHHHFSRVTIDAGAQEPFEVGVLAAGTPSAGQRPGRFGYHFNVLRLDAGGHLEITPYEASGGSFKQGQSFLLEDRTLSAKRLYEQSVAVIGRRCKSVVSIRKLSPDGDLYHRMEYRGFRIEKGGVVLDGFPVDSAVEVSTTTGHIEGFDAGPLAGDYGLPGTTLHTDKTDSAAWSLRLQKGQVRFGRTLEKGDDPVDFFFHYHGINAYAMSAHQSQEMYGAQAPAVESAEVVLHDTPTEELRMLIQLPAGFTLDGYPQLVIEGVPVGSRLRPRHELQEALIYDTLTNMIVLRIPHPVLRVCYRIEWRLAKRTPLADYRISSLAGQAREVATLLQQQTIPTPDPDPLRVMLFVIANKAKEWFKLADAMEDQLDISIMVYDERTHLLKTHVGNFPAGDPRWSWTFRYGDGIAGRAYKMNTVRVFVKDYAVQTRTPYYYYPPAGKPIVDPWEIEEEAVVAIPLNHPDYPNYVYAVLNISSRRPGSQLVEVRQEDLNTTEFRKAINVACFAMLRGIDLLQQENP